ncbi:hypothetical protein Csa_013946 [Cucumis sativus]|uniref:Uncharacterized protein n=1 Tax=Cucumis sativus TaxID=3659 RepID=A0A0A0LR63_CUCSA|nr:hypothetical protein Csa_013946 [Cucumis sativus]
MSAQYVLISFNVQRRSPLQELAILALECLASKSTICSIWAMKSLESENIKLEIKVDPSFTDLPASHSFCAPSSPPPSSSSEFTIPQKPNSDYCKIALNPKATAEVA